MPAAKRVRSFAEVSLGLTPVAARGRDVPLPALRHPQRRETKEERRAREGQGPHRRRADHATAGQTILEVARANNKYIPALCYMEGLSAVGACRLCMVEVAGVGRLLPACTTPGPGRHAVVTTLAAARRPTARWRWSCCFAERNHICAVCVSNGHCELQTLAQDTA